MNAWIKTAIPIVVALAATAVFQKALEKGDARYHVHKRERLGEILDGSKAYDVLLLGSSRMHTTAWPAVIDSVAGTRTYNAGAEGGLLYEFRLTFDAWLAKHPAPKVVVLSIDGQSFESDRKMFFPIQYFNHLGNPAVAASFRDQEDFKWIYLKYFTPLRIIYYDDYAKSLALRGLAGTNELQRAAAFQQNGFLSNGYTCIDTTAKAAYKKVKLGIGDEAKESLRAIINTCRERGIKLMLTYAPEYRGNLQASFQNFGEVMATIDSIRGDVPFFRDDRLPLCNEPCYFANYGHVNVPGARAYSIVLGERLKEYRISNNE